jgi:hypothetical protein
VALLAGTVSFRVRRGKYFVTGAAKYLIVGGSRERERLPKNCCESVRGFRGGGGEVVNIVEYGMFRFMVVAVQGCAPGSKNISVCGSQVRCRYPESFLVPAERETGRAVVRPFMQISRSVLGST